MIDGEAYCVDILLQISAVQGALEQVEKLLLGRHIESCVADAHTFTREEIREAPRQRFELAEGDSRALVRAFDEDLAWPAAGVRLEQRVGVGVGAGAQVIHRVGYCAGEDAAVKRGSPRCEALLVIAFLRTAAT